MTMPTMGVLFDYFAADSDDRAAPVIDVEGGPEQAGLPSLMVKGIDPVVQLGRLESLLTGVDYDAVTEDPRWGHAVAVRDEGERLVLTVTSRLQHALAHASPAQLDGVADPWSRTEEFCGTGDAATLAEFLHKLAGLARGALSSGQQLYCWVCV